jgi:CHAT domain-containing protein
MIFIRTVRNDFHSRYSKYAWTLALLLLIPLEDTRPMSAEVQYNHAWQLFLHGDLAKSQQEAERGYNRFLASDPVWSSRFQILEAEAMEWRGLYQDAVSVLASRPSTPDNPEEAIQRFTAEGVALTHLHRFSEANQSLANAERLCASATHSACGGVLRARGVAAMERGQLSEARQYFLGSLAFARAHRDGLLETTALSGLGFASLQNEHYDEAVDWSKSAYRDAIGLGAQDMVQVASGNLGWAYFELGDADRALELFLDARNRAMKLGDVRFEIKWLTAAGYVYQDSGDIVRASQVYGQALGLAQKIDSKEDIVNLLEDLAHASIDTGRFNEASVYVQQLDPLVRANGNRLDVLDVMLAEARIAAARRQDQLAEAKFRAVESDPASQTSMRLGAEHELAKLYELQGNTAAADRMYRTSLTTFESARAQLKNEDSKLPFFANATRIYDDYIHFLVAHGKNDEALAFADRSRAQTLAQGLGLDTNIQAFKPAAFHPGAIAQKTGATLLFYWLGEKQSYLWAITSTRTALFPLPARREITAMVERYRNAVSHLDDTLESGNEDGLALYRTLIAPAGHLIRPGSQVVILNDGALSQLNFETLIVPGPTPHYFIDDATLISAPSLYMLASAKPSPRGGHKLLLLGDPISADPDYPELSMAALETQQIERHFAAADKTIFARRQANPAVYLASTPQQYSYIHFVAHGFASRMDPLDSAIILSRSSAAEDSFKLYAREIVQHPIHARLVTISACSGSGSRSYVGEGLVGLSWAFLRAGAHNVIGALWEVSDDSTPRMMDALYQGLEDGMSPSAALRQAKLTLLHSQGSFRRPFYWASFQIYAGL